MNIGIIDADLIERTKHRFPNLACMKLSSYYKAQNNNVELVTDYNDLNQYDQIFVSKVFTDTHFPTEILQLPNVQYGGSGFFFDKAPPLQYEIEHSFPDYHLYDDWIEYQTVVKKVPKSQFKEYTDCSIGFLTRGCFRHCKFCINQNYNRVFQHSPLSEFYDPTRKKICMLDDNFFGYSHWEECLQELIDTKKPFKFKQGLDERILTPHRCEMLAKSKYDGDLIFAFDNIADYDLIHKQLKLLREYLPTKNIKFYVLVGFESTNATDIENAFKRIELLMKYHCLPYIMRYQNKNNAPWKYSTFRGMYITLARWANQPSFIKKKSFREFCIAHGLNSSSYRYMTNFERKYPEIAKKYFDMKWGE